MTQENGAHTQFWNPRFRQVPFVNEVLATLDASVLGLHGEHAVCDQVVYLLVVVLRSGVKPTQAELKTTDVTHILFVNVFLQCAT